MLRPTAVAVVPIDNYLIRIRFDNGEEKKFDVKPYIKGEWYGRLKEYQQMGTLLFGLKGRIFALMSCMSLVFCELTY